MNEEGKANPTHVIPSEAQYASILSVVERISWEGNVQPGVERMNSYYVYIMTTKTNNVLYIGVTNDLERRVNEHKHCIDKNSFTARYKVNKLVYAENCGSIDDAIAREKQLKKWNRNKKFELIKTQNPEFRDLSEEE